MATGSHVAEWLRSSPSMILQNSIQGTIVMHVDEFYFFSTVGVNARLLFENWMQPLLQFSHQHQRKRSATFSSLHVQSKWRHPALTYSWKPSFRPLRLWIFFFNSCFSHSRNMFPMIFSFVYHLLLCWQQCFVCSSSGSDFICLRYLCTATTYLVYHVLISTPT